MFSSHAFLVPGWVSFVAVMLVPKVSIVSLYWQCYSVVRTALKFDPDRDDLFLELSWKHLIAVMNPCEYLKRP
jgi:hypothetical protein